MNEAHKAEILLNGPVGLWCTCAGTADILGTDHVRFNADGTGMLTTNSILFGTEDVAFLWKMTGLSLLNLRYVSEEDDDEPDYWRKSQIEFRLQQHDAGSEEVLCEAGSETFWGLKGPLRWVES